MHARFNTLVGSGTNTYPVDPGDQFWTVHPDEAADVAVLSINVERLRLDGIEYTFFDRDDHAFTLDQARDAQVSEGDGVFVLGFPLARIHRWEA